MKNTKTEIKEMEIIESHWATAWQWLEQGRIVFKDAKPRKGDKITYNAKPLGFSPNYYYYYICDTYPPYDHNQAQVEKLKKEFNPENGYDGRLWW